MNADKKEDEPEVHPFLDETNEQLAKKEKPHKDITCGFSIFKGSCLQRLATGKMFVIIYGISGCLIEMVLAYFNGTITTLEKRYKIPTQISGIIITATDISMMLTSVLAGYYIHKVHRPRWIGFGFFLVFSFCVLTSSLHLIYGPGEDALKLTEEYGDFRNISLNLTTSHADQKLCMSEEPSCNKEVGIWVPQVLLFCGQLIAGMGKALFWIVGLPYMDDNTSKAKSPVMLGVSTFLRMLGPALGYSLASFCLRYYIEPTLHPLIKPGDQRWMGAWWLGWIILGVISLLIAFVISLFPKELPSARARRIKLESNAKAKPEEHKEVSQGNMWQSLKRLLTNKLFVYNMFASYLYFFGFMAFLTYTPKYIETQYRQSASMASLATGTFTLGFSAIGIFLSTYIVSKYQPSARTMISWNYKVDFVTVAGIVGYIFIGCEGSDQLSSMMTVSDSCSASCHCDYVHYAPICSPENITYVSACHAGCTDKIKDTLGHNMYTGCGCMDAANISNSSNFQSAVDGACPVDCTNQFLIFVSVMCFIKLINAFGKANTLLINLRCVPPEDKSFGLGLSSTIGSLTAFIPSPIFFGWLMDKYCLVWGKTCSNKGNCWVYDTQSLRYAFNLTSATFIFLGAVFNILVWCNAKDLKIFDDEKHESSKYSSKAENLHLSPINEDGKKPKDSEDFKN